MAYQQRELLFDFLDHTDSAAGKTQYFLYEALSKGIWKAVNGEEGRERGVEGYEGKDKTVLQQESRVRTRSRDRAMRLIDVQDQAFKPPPGGK